MPIPNPPSSLGFSGLTSTSVNLNWTDNSSDETAFKVERSLDNSLFTLIVTLAANTSNYADVSLASGQTYYYRVRASNASGDSAPSNTQTIITTLTIPSPPAALVVKALGQNSIKLTWADVSSNEDAFIVEQSVDNITFSLLVNLGPNVTTYTHTSLTPATLHYYRVKARNAAGDSTYSNTASATTTAGPPSFTVSPNPATSGSNISITATGINTLWTQAPATLFQVSGQGMSISGISILNDTSATFSLNSGVASGNITVTDTFHNQTTSLSITNASVLNTSGTGAFGTHAVLSAQTIASAQTRTPPSINSADAPYSLLANGSDETAKLQNVINLNTSKIIDLPAGTINVSADIVIPDNCHLRCQKGLTTIKSTHNNARTLLIASKTNVTLENIIADNNNSVLTVAQDFAHCIGIYIQTSTDVRILGCEAKNATYYGLTIYGSTNVRVKGGKYHNNKSRGIILAPFGASTISTNVIISKNEVYSNGNGLTGASLDGTGIGVTGYDNSPSANVYIPNLIISENIVHDNATHGIVVTAAKEVIISTNICYNHTGGNSTVGFGSGILLSEATVNCTIQENICYNNQFGIDLDTATTDNAVTWGNHLVQGNITHDNIIGGINNQDCPDTTIDNNISFSNGIWGIQVVDGNGHGGSDRTRVTNNKIHHNAAQGIHIGALVGDTTPTKDLIIADNEIHDTGGSSFTNCGIYIEGPVTNIYLRDNRFKNNHVDIGWDGAQINLQMERNIATTTLFSLANKTAVTRWLKQDGDDFFKATGNNGSFTEFQYSDAFTLIHRGRDYTEVYNTSTDINCAAIAAGYLGQRLTIMNRGATKNVIFSHVLGQLHLPGKRQVVLRPQESFTVICVNYQENPIWAYDGGNNFSQPYNAMITSAGVIQPDLAKGTTQKFSPTSSTAFIVAAPLNPAVDEELIFDFYNNALGFGVATFDAIYVMLPFVNPASGKHRTGRFYFDGVNWIQVGQWSGDF